MGLKEFGLVLVESKTDFRSIAFYKALFAEFLATLLFLFFTLGNVFNNCTGDYDLAGTTGKADGKCQMDSSRVLSISFSFGVAIFVLVYATASFSGGHINPAVTVGLALGKRISVVRAFCYIIAQIAGAVVGAGFAKAVNIEGFNLAGGGANKLTAGITYGAGWTMETILTFALVFMVYAATDSIRGLNTAHIPVLAPLAIGLVVFLCHLVAIPIDGCSINPARSFGAAAIANQWDGHWLFWIGPLSGGIIAAAVYELVLNFAPKKAVAAIEETAIEGAAKLEPYPGTEGLGQHVDVESGGAHKHTRQTGTHPNSKGELDSARGNGAQTTPAV